MQQPLVRQRTASEGQIVMCLGVGLFAAFVAVQG